MNEIAVQSEITGMVWKVLVAVGEEVFQDQELVILESMKMEIPVVSPVSGTVLAVNVQEGASVQEGTAVVTISVK